MKDSVELKMSEVNSDFSSNFCNPDSESDIESYSNSTSGLHGIKARTEKNPLEKIASQAAFLGTIVGSSTVLSFYLEFYCFPLYLVSLSIFHFLEYWITAKYNPSKVTVDSFLINHSGSYTMAHGAAISEALIEYYFFPYLKTSYKKLQIAGVAILILGQALRSLAMKTAGESFSHIIVTRREKNHKLVTNGVYNISRHPSYTGYFWWALGSQLLLVNPLCFIGFAVVLFRFFEDRIQYEEVLLLKFFGDDYKNYKQRKGVLIPFMK